MLKKIAFLCAFIATFSLFADLEKVNYRFSGDPIDVVIPCHVKDSEILEHCLAGIKENIANLRRIIVVSKERITDEAEWFSEEEFPFSLSDVAHYTNDHDVIGDKLLAKKPYQFTWLYQQLLKLYAPYVIPEISSNILIVDADVIFFKPLSFTTTEGCGFLTASPKKERVCQRDKAHILFMKGCIPGLGLSEITVNPIVHHMLFQKEILDDLFSLVETHHQKPLWQVLCKKKIFKTRILSEYELYYYFATDRTDQVQIRSLKWDNKNSLQKIEQYRDEGYDYVAIHHYLRNH